MNSTLGCIDSHAHLSDLSTSELRSACCDLAAVLNVGLDLVSSRKVCEQSVSAPFPLYCAVGIAIPHIVENVPEDWCDVLDELMPLPGVVAVGETGIDGANSSYPPLELQKEFFLKHMDIAANHDVPVIVHSRGAEEMALDLCLEKGMEKVLFHCYTGSAELIPNIMDAGYYVSLSGIVTFKNGGLDRVARDIDLDRLLIETDSPYLAPVPVRGTKNIPNNVQYVGQKIAELREVPVEQLVSQLTKNFERLFAVSVTDEIKEKL